MRFRERENERQRQNPAGQAPEGGNLDALRAEANELLAAGDDAINRVLSGNSEAFLLANRQQGGQ